MGLVYSFETLEPAYHYQTRGVIAQKTAILISTSMKTSSFAYRKFSAI
jgi:hypothetical protein